MADEQQREAEFLLQILQQVHDLRLHRDIKRRDRLIANDQVRFGCQSARNANTLALPAREFMRPAPHGITRQAHAIHQIADALFKIGAILGEAEIADWLRQNIPHPHARVERGIGVLKHHLHAAAKWAQRTGRHVINAGAIQRHLAAGDVEQAQNGLAHRGFAAAGFTHQRQGFPLGDGKGNSIHRIDIARDAAQKAGADGEVFLEVMDLEQRRAHAAAASFMA